MRAAGVAGRGGGVTMMSSSSSSPLLMRRGGPPSLLSSFVPAAGGGGSAAAAQWRRPRSPLLRLRPRTLRAASNNSTDDSNASNNNGHQRDLSAYVAAEAAAAAERAAAAAAAPSAGNGGAASAAAAAALPAPGSGAGRLGPRRPRAPPHALDDLPPFLAGPLAELRAFRQRVSHLWGSFVPMASLFFLLSFVNTLLDSLKDTLIITSPGGGAHVLPFLSLYAVLPCSVLFLVAYAYATQRLSRGAVFNVIVGAFAAFFAAFGLFLHPNAEALHAGAGLAAWLEAALPAGLEGAVGMTRNWCFTLFYCAGELWGDVCMGLCFWTLANDTTALSDAPTLYPLLGLGANVAQAVAGMLLRAWNDGTGAAGAAAAAAAGEAAAAAAGRPGSAAAVAAAGEAAAGAAATTAAAEFLAQSRALMVLVVFLCGCALALHHWINLRFAEVAARAQAEAEAADAAEEAAAEAALARARALAGDSALAAHRAAVAGGAAADDAREAARAAREAAREAETRQRRLERRRRRTLRGDPREEAGGAAVPSSSTASPSASWSSGISDSSSSEGDEDEAEDKLQRQRQQHQQQQPSSGDGAGTDTDVAAGTKKKTKPPLRETFALLAGSVEIRCLAIMSLAQGLCSSLVEFCWKSHLRLLYPRPADFTAYLGGVAVWTGATTCALMLVSPVLFDRLGWRGVAGATPRVLAYGGGLFFAACVAYQHLHGAAAQAAAAAATAAVAAAPSHAAAAAAAAAAASASPPGAALLKLLVASGAVLFVFSRGAKFSLFKPAEEMVYVTLGEQARTKGKAAIDVVGSQAGKSGGSLLQQALLLLSAGSLTGIVPPMAVIFLLMLNGWRGAVDRLAVAREAQLAAVRHNLELTVDGDDASASSASAASSFNAGAGEGDEVARAAREAIAAANAALAAGRGGGGGARA